MCVYGRSRTAGHSRRGAVGGRTAHPDRVFKNTKPRNQGRPEVCPHRTRGVEGVLAWVGPFRFRPADRRVVGRPECEQLPPFVE